MTWITLKIQDAGYMCRTLPPLFIILFSGISNVVFHTECQSMHFWTILSTYLLYVVLSQDISSYIDFQWKTAPLWWLYTFCSIIGFVSPYCCRYQTDGTHSILFAHQNCILNCVLF